MASKFYTEGNMLNTDGDEEDFEFDLNQLSDGDEGQIDLLAGPTINNQ